MSYIFFCTGIFAPISRIAKPGSNTSPKAPPMSPKSPVKAASLDISHVTARVDSGEFLVSIISNIEFLAS